MSLTTISKTRTFNGHLLKFTHPSTSTKTPMSLSLFLPPSPPPGLQKPPLLLYLSGLTCTPDNCAEKGFLHPHASRHGLAIAYPDTSPRGGTPIPGEDADWEVGVGAGFYVDATTDRWRGKYNMYSYVVEEVVKVLEGLVDVTRVGILGHSMGGHGALVLYLRNPEKYRSVSAFAPICNPSNCPWGRKAFAEYFGEEDKERWAQHDATELVKAWDGPPLDAVLIDVGTADGFYKQGQLLPEEFEKAVGGKGGGVRVRYQDGYDHSYFFVSSFAGEHVDFHAKFLLQ